MLLNNLADSYEDYIKAIASNLDACLVKIADLRDNSDITRLKGLREKDIERIAKYHRAYLFLTNAIKNHEAFYGNAK